MELSLEHISFSYDKDIIINDAACLFSSGQFYAVLGPNGSGKTTLLDLISGFLSPQKGNIRIDGIDIHRKSKKELARHIALVAQDYVINFPFLVREIVMMGRHPYIDRFSQPTSEDYERVENAIKACGIESLQDRKINELSGGERQRCVFARALCQDTPILLLDEAFSSMDISHTLQLLRLVKRSANENGRIVISVFHDLNIASTWSDQLVMMKNGEIKRFGLSEDIFSKQLIQDIFDVNAVVDFNPDLNAKQVYYPIN